MKAVPALAGATLIAAIVFTTWALYITLVEHPARLDAGAGAGRAQFRASYRRAAPWQASFAAVALLAGASVATLTGHWLWLAGALALGAAIPLTLVIIRPVNQRLLSAEPLADTEALGLLQRWGRLHSLRTLLGATGLMTFLYALRAL